jgi:UTP--glucose-1-phosphate uridylyltransferase
LLVSASVFTCSKALPKEVLPTLDMTLIQYAAGEAILAGIDTQIFVIGLNKGRY